MTQYTHDTAPTQVVEADGIRFAYRRFGVPERTPVVFFQHFMGNLPPTGTSDGLPLRRLWRTAPTT